MPEFINSPPFLIIAAIVAIFLIIVIIKHAWRLLIWIAIIAAVLIWFGVMKESDVRNWFEKLLEMVK